MDSSITRTAALGQATTIDQRDVTRSISVDQSLSTLRQVVSDLGYSLDALQSAMGKDRSFINKVLNGDKPMPEDFIDALPDDVEAEWHARRAEAFGRVVVAPVTGPDAIRNLVSGLIGVLAPQLPVRTSGQLKAELPERKARRA